MFRKSLFVFFVVLLAGCGDYTTSKPEKPATAEYETWQHDNGKYGLFKTSGNTFYVGRCGTLTNQIGTEMLTSLTSEVEFDSSKVALLKGFRIWMPGHRVCHLRENWMPAIFFQTKDNEYTITATRYEDGITTPSGSAQQVMQQLVFRTAAWLGVPDGYKYGEEVDVKESFVTKEGKIKTSTTGSGEDRGMEVTTDYGVTYTSGSDDTRSQSTTRRTGQSVTSSRIVKVKLHRNPPSHGNYFDLDLVLAAYPHPIGKLGNVDYMAIDR